MGRADRWMRRLFGLLLVVAIVGSTSWIVPPVANRLLAMGGSLPVEPNATAGAAPSTPDTAAGGAPTPPGSTTAPGGAAEGPAATARPGIRDGSLLLPPKNGYIWPLVGAKLTTYFAPVDGGTMILGGQAIHNGIDIARPCWTPIRAAHDGTVLYAGRRADPFLRLSGSVQPYYDELARRKLSDLALPIMVVVDDGNGLIGVYVHLARAIVASGDRIGAGQIIGYEGRTGRATGCHLHYSLILAEGPWVPVAPLLIERWHYPAYMRLRVDPLLYLPLDSPDAAVPVAGLTAPIERPSYVAPERSGVPSGPLPVAWR